MSNFFYDDDDDDDINSYLDEIGIGECTDNLIDLDLDLDKLQKEESNEQPND